LAVFAEEKNSFLKFFSQDLPENQFLKQRRPEISELPVNLLRNNNRTRKEVTPGGLNRPPMISSGKAGILLRSELLTWFS
jgi:hypothetical protein